MDEVTKKTGNRYKYAFDLSIDSLSFIIPNENIMSFGVVHDFINNKVPIYMVKLFLNMEQYIELLDLMNAFKPVLDKIDFRVMKFEYVSETELKEENETNYTTFRSYHNMSAIVDRVDDLDATDIKNSEATGKQSDDKNIVLNLRLYSPADISATSKGYSNSIIPSGTVAQGLYDIINDTVIDTVKVFPVSVDNTTTFTNMVLPALGFDAALQYIHDEYGLYKYNPTHYCRDNILFIFPISGVIDDSGNGVISKKIYIDVRNTLDTNSGDYIELDDAEKIHVVIGKSSIMRNKIYNVKHTLYAYIGDDGIRVPKASDGKLYDTYKVISKNAVYADISEDIKQRMVAIPCAILPPEMDVYPTTMIKIIYDRIEGDYRVSKFTEIFTCSGHDKRLELHSINE